MTQRFQLTSAQPLSIIRAGGNINMDKKLKEYFSKMGKKSAKVRMKKISPEERKRIATAAAKARWSRKAGSTSC
jgi:hypothetical protein